MNLETVKNMTKEKLAEVAERIGLPISQIKFSLRLTLQGEGVEELFLEKLKKAKTLAEVRGMYEKTRDGSELESLTIRKMIELLPD